MSDRPEWYRGVSRHTAETRPRYRWHWLTHSFTPDLVEALLHRFGAHQGDLIADPYCGAGTTLVAASELGVASVGANLSPVAVLPTAVKTACYDTAEPAAAQRSLTRLQTDPLPLADPEAAAKYHPPEIVEEALGSDGLPHRTSTCRHSGVPSAPASRR